MNAAYAAFKGSFQVSMPLSTLDSRIDFRSVEIHQEIDKQDLAVVEARSRFVRYFETMAPGTPIRITYRDRAGGSGQFVGYISKVSATTKASNNQYAKQIVCVAASREFRNTARNTWRNRTAPEIVQDIGRRTGFRVVTKQHPLRRKQIVQGGDTYWEVLTKLARMTGYVLRAEGTTLYFLPLKDMVAAFASTAPIAADTTMADTYKVSAVEVEATLGNTSDDADDASDAAVVVAVGPNDLNATTAREVPNSAFRNRRTSTSTYERYNPAVVAHTRQDAKLLAKGMADRGMMAYDGRVFGQGDPLIAPYRPIYVATKDRNIRGYWIVKRVVHRIENGQYTCETTISTDEVSPQRSAPAQRKYRDIRQELSQGWSPFLNNSSRLQVLEPGFVSGVTFRADSRVARWVAS